MIMDFFNTVKFFVWGVLALSNFARADVGDVTIREEWSRVITNKQVGADLDSTGYPRHDSIHTDTGSSFAGKSVSGRTYIIVEDKMARYRLNTLLLYIHY